MIITYFVLVIIENIDEAYKLIQDLEPSSPQEYILKAVANTVMGQERGLVRSYSAIIMRWWVLY